MWNRDGKARLKINIKVLIFFQEGVFEGTFTALSMRPQPVAVHVWSCWGLRSQPGLGNKCSALSGADPPPRRQLLFKPLTESATFSEIYLKSISSPERDQTLTA